MSYNRGDKVLVNGGVLATVLSYDEAGDHVVFETQVAGGGTDTHTAHISNTRLEALPTLPIESEAAAAVEAVIEETAKEQ